MTKRINISHRLFDIFLSTAPRKDERIFTKSTKSNTVKAAWKITKGKKKKRELFNNNNFGHSIKK